MTTSDNEWQRMTTSGATSDNELQRVTTSGATSDNKWQRMTTSGTKSDSECERVTAMVQRMKTAQYTSKNGWLSSFQWQKQIQYYFKRWITEIKVVR